METTYKICLKCKQSKALIYFCINTQCADNLNKVCKSCKNKYDKNVRDEYRKIHKFSKSTAYREESLEKFLRISLNCTKSSAKRRNIFFDLKLKDTMDCYEKQKGLCNISGIPMTNITRQGHIATNISVDRIDNTKPYEVNNIHLVCYIVNIMKHTSDLNTFINFCKIISNYNQI